MTNVIVDAGTDAKIAKFQKRGIELIDLALLEPVEVWGEKDKQGEKIARRESMRISVDEMGAMVTPIFPVNASMKSAVMSSRSATFNLPGRSSRPATPSAASSSTSLHSQSQQNLRRNSSILTPFTVANHSGNANLDDTNPISMPAPIVMPVPHPAPAPQSLQPQPKRNLFNKLFNKKGSGEKTGSPFESGSPTPTQSTVDQAASSPSFGSFSLHPAPMTNKLLNSNSGNTNANDKRGRPPALVTPSPVSPSSLSSQQTTPTAPQTPRQTEPYSPTPTVAPTTKDKEKEKKGHGRNISLTSAITTPFKTTLKNNRDRLSAVISNTVGSSSSSMNLRGDAQAQAAANASTSGTNLMVPGTQRSGEREIQQQQGKRDASPGGSGSRDGSIITMPQPRNNGSRSQLSLNAAMMADHGRDQSNGFQQQQQQQFYPLVPTQSQARDELINLKQQQLQLRPPVLGIQPTFVSSAGPAPHIPPAVTSPLVAALSPRMSSEVPENLLQGQRALMYVWLVRRWLKRQPSAFAGGHSNESGLFSGLGVTRAGKGGAASLHSQENSSSNGLAYGGVEVRFEWKRAKGKDSGKGSKGKKSRSRRGRAMTSTDTAGSDGEIERSSSVRRNRTRERDGSMNDPKERLRSEEKKKNRMSTGSFSTTTASTEEGTGKTESPPEDNGEESDPEDSETPWVCTLKIRRAAPPGGMAMPIPMHQSDLLSPRNGGKQSYLSPVVPTQVLRVKVGTLSPTPHHPKVVAMLKVPFPLPDVEVERMSIVKRKGFPVPGQQQSGDDQDKQNEDDIPEREPYHGLTLTAEEIKDMVCSTGLWLVVREGFGGVGKVNRKGDGWRIRA